MYARLARYIPVVVGKSHGHHVGKELYSVAYLKLHYKTHAALGNAWMVSFYALSVQLSVLCQLSCDREYGNWLHKGLKIW